MKTSRIALFRERNLGDNNSVSWFCAYAKYAVFNSSKARFFDAENLTSDFVNEFLVQENRSFHLEGKNLISKFPNFNIKNIESLTGKLLICFRSGDKINLGGKYEFEKNSFFICDKLKMYGQHYKEYEYYFKFYNVENIDEVISELGLFCHSLEVSGNNLTCKALLSNKKPVLYKVEPYFKVESSVWEGNRKLSKVNHIDITDDNVLIIKYVPKNWEYVGSTGITGSKNMHKYEMKIDVWQKQFCNYKELNDYLLSIQLPTSFAVGEWQAVEVKGGKMTEEIDEYIEDNR